MAVAYFVAAAYLLIYPPCNYRGFHFIARNKESATLSTGRYSRWKKRLWQQSLAPSI